MTLANKLTQAHEQAIYNSRGINSAKKKMESKGKKYSQKDLKGIMQNIDFAVSANKVNGKYMDTYYENVGDDANHIILAFHTGAMINRMEDFEQFTQEYQYTLGTLASTFPKIASILGIGYYPVSKIKDSVNQEMKEDIERIEKYIKDGILLVGQDGSLEVAPKVGRVAKKTIERARAYYKVINGKLHRYFINPKFYDKYVGIVYSPDMTEDVIKKYTAIAERKSYVDKNNRGFLLDFALKIAERSYVMTVGGKPIIKIDEYFNQFPEIKQLLENKTDIAKTIIAVVDKKYLPGDNVNSELKIYTPFMSSVIAFDTNFPVAIRAGGALSYMPREVMIFLRDIVGTNQQISDVYRIDAIDYSSYINKLGKIPNKPTHSFLKDIAKHDKGIQRMIFIYNKLTELLEKAKNDILKTKKDFKCLKEKFNNSKYFDVLLTNILLSLIKEENILRIYKNAWILNPKTEEEQKIAQELIKGEVAMALINKDDKTLDEIKGALVSIHGLTDEGIEAFISEVKEDIKNKKSYINDFKLISKLTEKYTNKIKKEADKQNYNTVIAIYELAVDMSERK